MARLKCQWRLQKTIQGRGESFQTAPRKHISDYLVGRCPKCFAVEKTGVLLVNGGDFQCALDGNFGHRRNKKAGQCPPIQHRLRALVPKEFIDAVGDAIDDARA
ncbi:hypothetical protein AURDEDRAFT_178271 [Auricularia subglabra TFB-10046 SS5]|uniref:Uncharacterized protein n=1 Tax=Auricularia subglabra (strain TFB-10046 / SS5) TaxID=717982 RepID=J0WK20_AURST|nr:hypothetical protein AURDEDRAFT_178271 [Auricularia subglabra TFB-10046 SS5]